MEKSKAIITFSRPGSIKRSPIDSPLAGLSWNELDSLSIALQYDFIQTLCQLYESDILLFRDRVEFSDIYITTICKYVKNFDAVGKTFNEQVKYAIETALLQNYRNIIVCLENNPLYELSLFQSIFSQLQYEDDCFVIGSTSEGEFLVFGMKANHSYLFSSDEGSPLNNQEDIIKRICMENVMLFYTAIPYSLSNVANIARLKEEIEKSGVPNGLTLKRTEAFFKLLDRKRRFKRMP